MAINIISLKNTKEEGVKNVLNMISFANAQGTLKIEGAGSKVWVIIISFSNIVTSLHDGYVKGYIFLFLQVCAMKLETTLSV